MISRIYLALQKHEWMKLEFDPKFWILKKRAEENLQPGNLIRFKWSWSRQYQLAPSFVKKTSTCTAGFRGTISAAAECFLWLSETTCFFKFFRASDKIRKVRVKARIWSFTQEHKHFPFPYINLCFKIPQLEGTSSLLLFLFPLFVTYPHVDLTLDTFHHENVLNDCKLRVKHIYRPVNGGWRLFLLNSRQRESG